MTEIISMTLLVLPTALLILYVGLRMLSKRTQTKIDDHAVKAVGEVLEGLGRPVPKETDEHKCQDS